MNIKVKERRVFFWLCTFFVAFKFTFSKPICCLEGGHHHSGHLIWGFGLHRLYG